MVTKPTAKRASKTEIILNAGQFVISMCLLVAVCFIRWLGAVRELKIRYGYEI
jgi:hypothetical protein